MQGGMLFMARIDDYVQAKKIAVESLAKTDFIQLQQRAGFTRNSSDTAMVVPFLNRVFRIELPSFEFTDVDNESKDVPIQEQVLILHYLKAETFPSPTGRWVSYREIPGATFYHSAFLSRAVNPLKNVLGRNIEGFKKAAEKLQGKKSDTGDAAYEFYPFPKIPLMIIIWKGDEEFPPEANIVFDESIGGILSPEDIAWMAGMLVYRLIGLSQ
jgi:hypothetical protein